MKSAVITITHVNYGNRLQNYATVKFLEKLSLNPENISIHDIRKKTILKRTKDTRRRLVKRIIPAPILCLLWEWKKKSCKDALDLKKEKIFQSFTDSYIKSRSIKLYHRFDLKKLSLNADYDYFFAGSDQIWNPDFAGDDYYFLDFTESKNKISFAASIGYESISKDVARDYAKYWNKMKYISVREDSAADIIEKSTGKRPDVFLDPTMLLTRTQWTEIMVKPNVELPKKYVVCLFLGRIPEYIKETCLNIFKMEVVILNEKTYPDYFLFGPSEFLYVIKNAELVMTDSFHCTVFSILFHKQFWVFKRKQDNLGNMFTRVENLLQKMDLLDRIWKEEGADEKIVKNNYVDKIITEERFLKSDGIMKREQRRVEKILKDILKL